jgi:hypothetical protein
MKNFTINKGVNKPMEFKGFQAQYIAYMGIGLLGVLVLFTTFYLTGIPMLINAIICGLAFAALYSKVYALNRTYGAYGMMKKMALRQVPSAIKLRDRRFLLNLKKSTYL